MMHKTNRFVTAIGLLITPVSIKVTGYALLQSQVIQPPAIHCHLHPSLCLLHGGLVNWKIYLVNQMIFEVNSVNGLEMFRCHLSNLTISLPILILSTCVYLFDYEIKLWFFCQLLNFFGHGIIIDRDNDPTPPGGFTNLINNQPQGSQNHHLVGGAFLFCTIQATTTFWHFTITSCITSKCW
jgi:hypothetical protein